MKKILFIYNDMKLGGVQRVRVLLANELIRKGYDVKILITGYDKKCMFDTQAELVFLYEFFPFKPLVKLFYFWTKNKLKGTRYFNSFILKNATKNLKGFFREFDLIVSSYGAKNFYYILHEMLAHDEFCKKTYKTIHDSQIETYLGSDIARSKEIFSKYAGIISLNSDMDEIVYKNYGFENRLIIPNPLNFAMIDNLMQEKDEIPKEKYIVGAGRLNTQKGFDMLIQAYSKSLLPKKNIKLLILGEGELLDELQELIDSLNLKDLVILTGFTKNPYKFLSNALFYVMSSRKEGLPNILLEALYCETPSISFDCLTGPRDIITHQENGVLIELCDKWSVKEFDENKIVYQQDIENLISAINLLLEDEDFYNKIKSNSRNSVLKFNIENIVSKWENLLK